jgi:hypothetical protein
MITISFVSSSMEKKRKSVKKYDGQAKNLPYDKK